MTFKPGEEVTFHSTKKTKLPAIVKADLTDLPKSDNVIVIKIDGDPFPVTVPSEQVTRIGENPRMASKTALKKEARTLSIEGWEEMDTATLKAAIAEAGGSTNGTAPTKKRARKSPAKKAAAKAKTEGPKRKGRPPKAKAATTEDAPKKRGRPKGSKNASAKERATKKATSGRGRPKGSTKTAENIAENGTPFRTGSNMEVITKELMKGGKRATIISRLNKKIEVGSRTKKAKDIDAESEMDKRIAVTVTHLKKKFGYVVVTEGRGVNGTIKVIPPDANEPRNRPKAAKTTKARKAKAKK